MDLNTPVIELSRVGKAVSGKLKKLKIETVKDLIFYYPFRYDDFSRILPVSSLRPGITATIKARIMLIQNKRSFRRRMMITEALAADETGTMKIIWFNQPFLTRTLKIGDEVYFSGKVDNDYYGIQMTSPSYERSWGKKKQGDTTHTARLVPVYSLTAGITEKQLRFIIRSVLDKMKQIDDWVPDKILKELGLMGLLEAVKEIHFPSNKEKLEKAGERLKFDELFLIQLVNQKARADIEKLPAPAVKFREDKTRQFVKSLPFELTDAQRLAAWDVLRDMEKTCPMNRLVEGDVGSGKTVVAVLAALNGALNGYQSVLMAPTEILARQHFISITRMLEGFDINTGLLTRTDRRAAIKGKEEILSKAKISKEIGSGRLQFIIGTHALIQENINFHRLGLAVVDEQHRFGVDQRKHLRQKSGASEEMPHLLSMTATPIPRTLSLALYGDLDLSIIRQMPKNRKKIITRLVDNSNRLKAYEFMRTEIRKGRQCFVVCPLIAESDKLGVRSVEEEYERLNDDIFHDLNIGKLHGKLKAKEKEEIMKDMLRKKIDILVSTSVVEVGIDVPNATVMMIEGADRFGLAQLHQFRGRVGRGEHQSYCFLFTESSSEKTKERMEALAQSSDGFDLAEKDLEFRGPGEVYGTRQSGLPDLKIASLTDMDMVMKAKKAAEGLLAVANWPELFRPAARRVAEFERSVHFE